MSVAVGGPPGTPVDHVLQLLREGASAGLHVVVAGDRALLSGRVASLVQRTLVLRLNDPADLVLARLDPARLGGDRPPGRAVWAGAGHEVQVAVLGPGPHCEGPGDVDPSGAGQNAAVAGLGTRARARDRGLPVERRPFTIATMPGRLPLTALL